MKAYKLHTYDKYQRYFIYRKPNEYEDGKLYAISWYYSLCDWNGNELDGFYSEDDIAAALDEGYYSEDTQTLVYPLINGEELHKDDPCYFDQLKQGTRTMLDGTCYKEY